MVTFDQFKASLLNKIVNFFKKNLTGSKNLERYFFFIFK